MADKEGGSNCLKMVGIGCIVLMVLGAIGGYVVYKKGAEMVRAAGAMLVVTAAQELISDLELSPEEEEAAMQPVLDFSKDIIEEKVSAEQVLRVAAALSEGPAFAAITMRGFEARFLKKSGLTQEEKDAGHITVTRFEHGLSKKTLAAGKEDEVLDIVTVTHTDTDGTQKRTLKQSITDDELKKCLDIMKTAADDAGIPNQEFKTDLAAEIRKAIQAGMGEDAKGK